MLPAPGTYHIGSSSATKAKRSYGEAVSSERVRTDKQQFKYCILFIYIEARSDRAIPIEWEYGESRRIIITMQQTQFPVAPNKMVVNKQFNSPINLYSTQALNETLAKQTTVLCNGAIG
ncbi:hypothetical protein B566_EDAN014334 [Ephemera danica]|nr:hypothetical protein B566_EDAN014334 [Ephemera danica]